VACAALCAIAAILGIVIVFRRAAWLDAALKVVEGLYQLYLGVTVWWHAVSPIGVADSVERQTRKRAFGQTFSPRSAIQRSRVFVSVLPGNPPPSMLVAILLIVFANEAACSSVVALGLLAAEPRAQCIWRLP
jgi:threonine/homoserine/homoserine lactone efflux protein